MAISVHTIFHILKLATTCWKWKQMQILIIQAPVYIHIFLIISPTSKWLQIAVIGAKELGRCFVHVTNLIHGLYYKLALTSQINRPHVALRLSRTRSSAVAVIADRTAYDVRYRPTGKLSDRFRLQVYERLYARSESRRKVYERTQTLST